MAKASETSKIGGAVTAADLQTARTSTTFISVAGYRRVRGFGVANALAAGKKVTVQLKQATDAAGTGAKNFGTAVVGAADAREVSQDEQVETLDHLNGFTFVGVTVSALDNGQAAVGSGLVVLDSGRYSA